MGVLTQTPYRGVPILSVRHPLGIISEEDMDRIQAEFSALSIRASYARYKTAKGYVRPVMEWEGDDIPTLPYLAESVAAYFNINAEDLKSESRVLGHRYPRQIFCYMARVYGRKTLHKIGHYLKRDHTTVLHAEQKYSRLIKRNDAKTVADIYGVRRIVAHEWGHEPHYYGA